MTKETEIKRQIKDYMNLKGIFYWYNLQGLGAQKGIPDLFALHEGKLFAIEVKTEKGRLTESQEEFLERVEENGGIPIVARGYEDLPFHETKK